MRLVYTLIVLGCLSAPAAAAVLWEGLPEPQLLWSVPMTSEGDPSDEWDHEKLLLAAGNLLAARSSDGTQLIDIGSGAVVWTLGEDDPLLGWLADRQYGRRSLTVPGPLDGLPLVEPQPGLPGHEYVVPVRGGRFVELYPYLACYGAGGLELWHRPGPRALSMGGNEFWNFYEDPLADVIYVFYGETHLVAFATGTGREIWHASTRMLRYRFLPTGGVLLAQGHRAIARGAGGEVLWTYDAGEMVHDARFWPGGIYLNCSSGIHALDTAGRLLWKLDADPWPWTCGPDGTLYLVLPEIWYDSDEPTHLVAVGANGTPLWSQGFSTDAFDCQLCGGWGVGFLGNGGKLMAFGVP